MRTIAFVIAVLFLCYDAVKLQHPEHMKKIMHAIVRYQTQGEKT